MLVVAGLDSLTEHLAEARSSTERMFEPQRLGRLPFEQTLRAFVEPAQRTGHDVEPALATRVAEASGGYPYFVQFFGARLWRAGAGRAGR